MHILLETEILQDPCLFSFQNYMQRGSFAGSKMVTDTSPLRQGCISLQRCLHSTVRIFYNFTFNNNIHIVIIIISFARYVNYKIK